MMSTQTYYDNVDELECNIDEILRRITLADDCTLVHELEKELHRLRALNLAFQAEYGQMFSSF